MKPKNVQEIYSYDTDFDHFSDITRQEPTELSPEEEAKERVA